MNAASKNYGARNYSQNHVSHQNSGHSQGGVGIENFTTAQKNINAAILEYLLKYGFMKSVDCLQVTPFS